MKLKTITINLICTLVSCYIPASIFSTYHHFTKNGTNSKIISVVKERRLKQDNPQKRIAIKNGYLPIYKPSLLKKHIDGMGIYPIGSLPYTKSYYCNEGYGLVKYYTDRFGLRNPDNVWENINKQKNIFLIGDSYTNGACVSDNHTIRANINNLSGINTINLGISANGPYEYIAVLRSLVSPIVDYSKKENIVVLIFYENDNEKSVHFNDQILNQANSIVAFNSKGLISPISSYTNKLFELIENNFTTNPNEILSEIGRKESWKEGAFYQIGTLFPVRYRIKKLLSREKLPLSKEPTQRAIESLSKICNDKCIPFTVYIPNSNFWEPNIRSSKYKKMIMDLSKRNKISFIDGEDVVDRERIEDYAPMGPHLSKNGYKKISKLITSKIITPSN